jgi:hypothetical protein
LSQNANNLLRRYRRRKLSEQRLRACDLVTEHDLFVLHRVPICAPVEALLRHIAEAGKTALFETDDLVFDDGLRHSVRPRNSDQGAAGASRCAQRHRPCRTCNGRRDQSICATACWKLL